MPVTTQPLPQPPEVASPRFVDWLFRLWKWVNRYEEGNTTPTPTAGGGAFTSASATVRYRKWGNRVEFTATVTITTNGTANAYVLCPLPYSASETTGVAGAHGNADHALFGYCTAGNVLIKKYDGTYPGADSTTLIVSGTYRIS